MDFTSKMLPLIAVLVSLCFSNTEAYRMMIRRPHYPYNPLYRRTDENADVCACFSRGDEQDLVPTRLKAQSHNNLKRVVAYFYIDIDTYHISTYIPDAVKQNEFPDLYLSEEDVLKHLTANSLFEEIMAHIKNEDKYLEAIHKTNQTQIDDVKNDAITVGTPLIEAETIHPIDSQADPSAKEAELAVSESADPLIALNTLEPMPIVSHSIYHTSTQSLPSRYYAEAVSVTPTIETVKEINSPANPSISKEVEPGSKSQQVEIIDFTPNPDTEDDSFYAKNNVIYNYPTFETWYQKQIAKFGITNTEKLFYINNNNFKDALKLTLSRNGIILSSDGYLRGLDGKIIDVNKLELRSVWIGERLNIKDLVSNKHTNLAKAPILQTVLVSLVYPPRILGIIPLGKTYLSSEGKSENHAVHSSSATLKSIAHGKYIGGSLHKPIESIIVLKTIPSVQQARSEVGSASDPIFLKPIPNSVVSEHFKSSVRSNPVTDFGEINSRPLEPIPNQFRVEESADNDQNNEEIEENTSDNDIIHREEDTRRNRYDVLKSLIELLQSQDKSDSEYEVDDDDDDVPPGVRIIGGKAAVSSGSLINNKGRSGFNHG